MLENILYVMLGMVLFKLITVVQEWYVNRHRTYSTSVYLTEEQTDEIKKLLNKFNMENKEDE